MSVDFFGNGVRAETQGSMVSLNDLVNAGNMWRIQNGMPMYQLNNFVNSTILEEYINAAAKVWNLPPENFINQVGKGRTRRTMAHVSVAVLCAEQISPYFHALVHKTFIEGKLLEFRDLGSTEFKALNAAIAEYLPEREGKDNKGVYIQVAKALRNRIFNTDGDDCWNSATPEHTHQRYEYEKHLCTMLRLGVVRNYDHLKELIAKL